MPGSDFALTAVNHLLTELLDGVRTFGSGWLRTCQYWFFLCCHAVNYSMHALDLVEIKVA